MKSKTSDNQMKEMTYRSSGVDIEAGNRLVELIKPLVRSTARSGADACIGGFAGLFDPRAAGFEDPLFMAATDGVGSKISIAAELEDYSSIGIDLVAMCVNDLLVRGVEPVIFLDYYACGRLRLDRAESLIRGIVEGCRIAGCALVGGETAEMAGLYGDDEYDLAGFAVGAVERDNLLAERGGEVGDVILGLSSSGLHANGFSLVRKFLQEKGIRLADSLPFSSNHESWGSFLLTPTRIYTRSILSVLKSQRIRAMAHITGGGLVDNVPRCLNEGVIADIDVGGMVSPIYSYFRDEGIAESELLRTFNCGVGMVLVVSESDSGLVVKALEEQGENVSVIGCLVSSSGGGEEGATKLRLFS